MTSDHQASLRPQYKLSFTIGALFYKEAVETAQLYVLTYSWVAVREAIIQSNCFHAHGVGALKRICREIISRLQCLTPEQLEIVADGIETEQRQMLWIAICKRYAFIRDFSIEVVCEKLLNLDPTLEEQDYTAFFNAKAQWHDELNAIEMSKQKKIKQVLFRMLRQAGILSPDNILIPWVVSPRATRALLNDPSDIYRAAPMAETHAKASD